MVISNKIINFLSMPGSTIEYSCAEKESYLHEIDRGFAIGRLLAAVSSLKLKLQRTIFKKGTTMPYLQTNTNYVVRENGFKMPGLIPTRSSILGLVHFNRIIGGACHNVTSQYNECSKWAYKRTAEMNSYEGRPAYCSNDDWMK
jgi:hypothetical protein